MEFIFWVFRPKRKSWRYNFMSWHLIIDIDLSRSKSIVNQFILLTVKDRKMFESFLAQLTAVRLGFPHHFLSVVRMCVYVCVCVCVCNIFVKVLLLLGFWSDSFHTIGECFIGDSLPENYSVCGFCRNCRKWRNFEN